MGTARVKQVHDHEVGVAKNQFLGADCEGSEMFGLGQSAQMLGADSGQGGDFFFGENLLARLYPDHSGSLQTPSMLERE
jgi:hypothetical protein